jgi:hypothetical protein
MPIRALVAALTTLVPTAALAIGMAPPLSVPAQPDAPPVMPGTGSPPVLDITLPAPLPHVEIPTGPPGIPGDLPEPPFEPPMGIPDLTGIVDLPTDAERVLALAPPFGAPFPKLSVVGLIAVPEPSTAALVALGLVGIAAGRRDRSSDKNS